MAETTKERLNKQFAQLESERQSFEPHWRELSDYINPRGSRFLTSEVNRNDRRNTRIIDSTGTMAARTLASGMMSGITSPARPWFRLATPDPEMMDYGPVKLWLEAVQNRMNDMFNKSNLYQSLPQLYGSLGTYSTGAMAVLEDDEDIIRTMPFPIGSYYLANSPRGSVDTCFRKFSMTVRQLVQEFGLNNVSESVKSMWESGTYEKWIEVMHSVYPNIDRDTSKLDSKNKPFKSVYYEVGGDNDKLLRESGFDEFPIMAPRWEVNGEDVYGSSCPGTGMRISGARANRGNASRQIHFKDADSYLQYQQLYGDRSLWEIMVGHLEGISKDIALVETYGPNPDHVFRSLLDQVKAETATANPSKTGKVERLANNTENLYNFISGKTQPVANPHIARWSDNIRNWLVASRLGSALLSSFSDLGTMYLSAKVTNLPMNQLFRNQLEAMDPTNRTELARARRAGLAMESLLGSVNRWAMDNMGPSVSRWAATAVMRASGLTAWSDAHKRAYGVTMMGSLGEVVSRTPDLRSLDDSDFRILKSKGITDTDWSVWKLAQQEDWGNGNNTMLTPESIMRIPDSAVKHLGEPERVKFEAMRKLLGAVTEEVDMAVITPGAREQLITGSGIQRGTWKGELTRSVFLFKSFPISVVMRHWSRAMGIPSAGGRAAYIATFIASTTILGALSQQLNDLASGRNPREMTGEDAAKFWLGALLKGGGLGLYGDFLLSDHTRYGSGALASMLGPVAGLVDDVVKIAQGIPLNAVEGKNEQTGGDLVKLGKGLMPGANLWYLKAALDHMIFNQMQEYFSPGYLRKMEQRSKKEFNQTYWWRPQDVTPQ